MATFTIKDAQGNVINTIVAGQEFVEAHFPGVWELVLEAGSTPPRRAIPKQLVIDRFTGAEWAAFSDPAAVVAVRKAFAMFQAYVGDIHPEHYLTTKLFTILVQNAVLANAARATAIMAEEA